MSVDVFTSYCRPDREQVLALACPLGFVVNTARDDDFDWIRRDSDNEPIRSHAEYIELMKDK